LKIRASSSLPIIVIKQSSEPFSAVDVAAHWKSGYLGPDELVGQTLVVSFLIVMRDELLDRPPQGCLPEENHPV